MTGLSEVSVLFGQNVLDIERAREIFTSETRNFVTGTSEALRLARPDPWSSTRVQVRILPDIDTTKVTGYLRAQYAIGRANIRFKKGTNFVIIADVNFGFVCRDAQDAFTWQIRVVPTARYPQLDDILWRSWGQLNPAPDLPGSAHESKSNSLCLCSRSLDTSLTVEVAYNDVKTVCDFILGAETAIAEAVGFDLSPGEEASATPVT